MAAPDKGLSFLHQAVLRNRLVLVFCVLALIAAAANVILILELTGVMAGNEIPISMAPLQEGQPEQARVADLARGIKTRLSVLLGITVVCLGSIMYLFLSRVVFPFHAMVMATQEMVKGNLAVAAPSHKLGNIGELGHMINNLAVNFQEVLLLTGTVVGNSCATVERIQHALEQTGDIDRKDMTEQVAAMKKDLEMLGATVKDFQFYQTRFDGQKVVAQRSHTEG